MKAAGWVVEAEKGTLFGPFKTPQDAGFALIDMQDRFNTPLVVKAIREPLKPGAQGLSETGSS